MIENPPVTSAKEHREFAAEWLRWATEVAEEERQAFLDLARDWTLAALRLEGVLIPEGDEKSSASASTVS